MYIRLSIVFLCSLFCVSQPAAQEASSLSVRDLMTQEEFRRAGLTKLSASELEALDAWFSRTAVEILVLGANRSPSPAARPRALDFSDLEGAVIVAEDGEFLGKITMNRFDPQSIGNEVGRFGSPVSRTSILNEIGQYGGQISRMSPFNQITSVPPRIFLGDRFIGYLTVNPVKSPRVDPRALIGWLRANE